MFSRLAFCFRPPLLSCLLLLGLGRTSSAAESLDVEVCVYGATPGGIAAAIATAQSGHEVLLVEPTARIGGLMSCGLTHSDFHSFESLSGAFLNLSRRVKAHYATTYGPDSPQVADSFEGTFAEPKVNLLVFEQMLAEPSTLQLRTRHLLTEVKADRGRLLSARFQGPSDGLEVRARIFIDGSYEGDLMARAGVAYHVGREGKDAYGESLAPDREDGELQGYNFRLCATDLVENRVPFTAPPGYRREDFLAVLPFLESGQVDSVFGYPPTRCLIKAHEPPSPNRKFDLNDVSRGLVRLSLPGHNLGWPDGDAETRQAIFDEHLRHNVGLIYFLSTDEAVPAHYREEAARWGWCRDEFTETGHLPPQLYVREARRMIGRHVYVQQDSEHAPGDARAKLFTDAIAMGDYGNNCHGTHHEGPLVGGTHGGEFYNPVPPYQIPYGVLLPKTIDNLLVPVAISSSHVGFCALRLEPIWMSLGQAAGHAAAQALESDQDLASLDLPRLQERLHRDGLATLYVSDVLPGDPDFEAVQWWGTAGGLHGLEPMPKKPGQRGERIHGQYFRAAPGHAAKMEAPLDEDLRQRWTALAGQLGVAATALADSPTRGDFIRAAFAAWQARRAR